MKKLILLFTMVMAGCASFDPDLSGFDSDGETGSGTSGMMSETGGDGDGDGDGDTSGETEGESTDTGEETDTGTPDPDMGGNEGFCGDGEVNGVEQCDGQDMGGEDCISQGFDTGTVSCNLDCTVNTDQCGLGFCPAQPQEGALSACDAPQQGQAYCEGGELCLGEPGQEGFCSAECTTDVECALAAGYAGCQAIPRCAMNQCIYECQGLDSDCPNPMSCEWSEVVNKFMCI